MAEYRVAELARRAGTNVRNVRVYRERGLLPPPRLRGRTGWYDDDHLARLRLIGRLLERGYSLANIAELLEAWTEHRSLADMLGIQEILTRPRSPELPAEVDEAGLVAALGNGADAAAVQRLVDAGLVVRDGALLRLPSPSSIRIVRDLVESGLPLPVVLDLTAVTAQAMDGLAGSYVATANAVLYDEDVAADPPGLTVAEFDVQSSRLVSLAMEAVQVQFSLAMERQLVGELGRTLTRRTRVEEAG